MLSSITGGEVDIDVAGHTELIGALIAARDEDGLDTGKLNLSTGSLNIEHLSNRSYSSNQSAGMNASVGVGERQDQTTPTQTHTDLSMNSSTYSYQNNSSQSLDKTLATIGQGSIRVGGEEVNPEGLNRDIANLTKDIYDVDRQQGNIELTVDHRLLTEEGRNQIKEDITKIADKVDSVIDNLNKASEELAGNVSDAADKLQQGASESVEDKDTTGQQLADKAEGISQQEAESLLAQELVLPELGEPGDAPQNSEKGYDDHQLEANNKLAQQQVQEEARQQAADKRLMDSLILGWEAGGGNGSYGGWITPDADYESYINHRQNEIDGFNQFKSELSGLEAYAFYGGANLYEGVVGVGESIGGLTRYTGVQGGYVAGNAWSDFGSGLQNLASYAYNDLAGFAAALAIDPFINAYDRYSDIYNNDGLAAMMGTMTTDGLVKGVLEGPTRGISIPTVTKSGGAGNSSGNTSGSGSSQSGQSANNTGNSSTPPFEANPALDVAEGTIQHTTHSLNQKINRQVKSVDELDAIKNPLKKTDVKYDNQGRPSEKFIGENATVAVNPETGKVVTVHPTSSKLAERLKKQKEGGQ